MSPELPLTGAEAAEALRAGTTTSVELTRTMLARADELDPVLGVYLARFDAPALAAAERADAELAAGIDRGPLHGLPIGVKDILATSEGPTTAQSLVLDPEWGAGRDGPVVRRLKAAGAVITGKLSTMEFAVGLPDPEKPFPLPRNPWNTGTWPGGSSSGTGAGVAAGLFYSGIGTDTGGSIRIPAAFCGVSGLMATYGRVPKSGCVPLGYSLDHIGPLARSARDCGAFLGVIAGHDPSDPTCSALPVPDYLAGLDGSLAGVRIGVEREHHFPESSDPAAEPCFDAAVAVLRGLGADVVEVSIDHYAETVSAMMATVASEMLAYHLPDIRTRWGDFFRGTRAMAALGALVSGADYVQAQRVRRLAQRVTARLFESVDLIVTPAAVRGAPRYDDLDPDDLGSIFGTIFTPYWDATGHPALVVPMGFTGEGLPLSLQLAARPFEEALLVRAGDAYQQATAWHLAEPPLATATTTA